MSTPLGDTAGDGALQASGGLSSTNGHDAWLADRVIGDFGVASGPSLVCVARVHGNEPAGAKALERVFATLKALNPPAGGRLLGILGNRRAYAKKQRFVERDLNRQWHFEHVVRLRGGGYATPLGPEDEEQLELLSALHAAFDEAKGSVFCLDMHTTSAPGVPFVVVGDTLPNRAFARLFRVPIVLGLEERLGGTLPEYTYQLGHVTIGFEAGQHDDPRSIDVHEAAVWVAMMSIGVVNPGDVPDAGRYQRVLREAGAGFPSVLEVRSRYALPEKHGFKMKSGFQNLERIRKGDLLASDTSGEIRADRTGWVLMPLYQGQGHDGFFVTTPVLPFWLTISAWLRRMRVDALFHWLPGVRRHPEQRGALIVNAKVARWYTKDIFHLLGFRQRTEIGDTIVISRREHDKPLPHKMRRLSPSRLRRLARSRRDAVAPTRD
jgi:succinylglutamate desuccinylase